MCLCLLFYTVDFCHSCNSHKHTGVALILPLSCLGPSTICYVLEDAIATASCWFQVTKIMAVLTIWLLLDLPIFPLYSLNWKTLYWHIWFHEEPLTSMEPFHSTKGSLDISKVFHTEKKVILKAVNRKFKMLWKWQMRINCGFSLLCQKYFARSYSHQKLSDQNIHDVLIV